VLVDAGSVKKRAKCASDLGPGGTQIIDYQALLRLNAILRLPPDWTRTPVSRSFLNAFWPKSCGWRLTALSDIQMAQESIREAP
jgi:hypothetical protein